MTGGGTVARGFLTSLGAAFLLLLWDTGGLVRLQWYVQSEVSILSNWGTHFTSCGSKNPPLQGFSRLQLTQRHHSVGADKTITTLTDSMRSCKSLGVSLRVITASTFWTF